MRQPLRSKRNRGQVATVKTIPAPVGGWNARDALSNMPPTDAVQLDNWFPTTSHLEIRGGQEDYSTGITGTVETLAVYTAMTGVQQMFAATDSDMYDVSSSGAATDEGLTVTNGYFQYINMGDGTNNWLLMFNGTDSPKYYNGSTWVEVTGVSSPALAGITPTSAVAPCQYHGSLFLLEKDTLSFWYLGAGAVGGTASEFDLAKFASRGGYLMWAETWSHDGGDGIDDYIVFMTSEGEAIIYTGTDPSDATKWTRVGTYFLGKPLGRRSFIKFGGDLLALTEDGVFNMAEGLKYAQINERSALTDKINNAFNTAAIDYGANQGWEITHYPTKNAILFNVPVTEKQEQFVYNTITGAWCRFTGWGSSCYAVFNKELYYGGSTVVQKAWTTQADDGTNITAFARTAFNSFGDSNQNKRFLLFKPLIRVKSAVNFLADLDIDFTEANISGTGVATPSTTSAWDVGTFDSATFSSGFYPSRRWTATESEMGYYAAGKLKIVTKTQEVQWMSSDYAFELGGIL